MNIPLHLVPHYEEDGDIVIQLPKEKMLRYDLSKDIISFSSKEEHFFCHKHADFYTVSLLPKYKIMDLIFFSEHFFKQNYLLSNTSKPISYQANGKELTTFRSCKHVGDITELRPVGEEGIDYTNYLGRITVINRQRNLHFRKNEMLQYEHDPVITKSSIHPNKNLIIIYETIHTDIKSNDIRKIFITDEYHYQYDNLKFIKKIERSEGEKRIGVIV